MGKTEKEMREIVSIKEQEELDRKTDEFIRRRYEMETEEVCLEAEVYEKIINTLRKQGKLTDDEREEAVPAKKSKRPIFSTMRWVAVVALTLFGVFGVTMTSQANRAYVMERVNNVVGNKLNVKINNDGNGKETLVPDKEAAVAIEEALLVEVPELTYMPSGMVYSTYEVLSSLQTATMSYEYENQVMLLYVATNDNIATGTFEYEGKLVESVEGEYQNFVADIYEIQANADGSKNYSVQWAHKNNYYAITGTIKLDELEKIIKNLMY